VSQDPDQAITQAQRRRRVANIAAVAVLVVVILIFAFQNTEDAEVDWIFWSVTGPLVFVIFASALAGFLLGIGAVLLRRRRQRGS
jgi:uncharacterized integral membrane protein